MPTFLRSCVIRTGRLAWAFLRLLASRPRHCYPWLGSAASTSSVERT